MEYFSEDPIGFAAGDANLYRYVGNSPTNFVDPNGLWKVERSGGNWAVATAQNGDTVRSLAKLIRLNEEEYQKWLKADGSSVRPETVDSELPAGCTYLVPNTVFAYSAQRVPWDISLAVSGMMVEVQRQNQQDRANGFKVVHVYSSSAETFKKGWKTDGIYKFRFAGHGTKEGIAKVDPYNAGNSQGASFVKPPYKLASVEMYMCFGGVTFADTTWREHVSRYGVFIGAPCRAWGRGELETEDPVNSDPIPYDPDTASP